MKNIWASDWKICLALITCVSPAWSKTMLDQAWSYPEDGVTIPHFSHAPNFKNQGWTFVASHLTYKLISYYLSNIFSSIFLLLFVLIQRGQ